MRKVLFFISAGLVLISSAFPQQWIAARVAALPNPESIDSLLSSLCNEAVGKKAPSFAFQDLANDSVHTLADYKGKVALVNFWGTNCSGCRMEMPDLSRLQESYREKGLMVVFLSSQSKQALQDFLFTHPVTGTKGIVDRNHLLEPYQMFALPSTILIDRTGTVKEMWLGPQTFEQLKKKVLPLLSLEH
jgi:peroxiredoxin